MAESFFTSFDIRNLVSSIIPFDILEKQDIQDTLQWIDSGAQLFRIKKPDKPAKHLVSYFVVFDERNSLFLLVHHIKAQQWLPAGGHVEINENPRISVERESQEELHKLAVFYHPEKMPLFITVRKTVGLTAGHTDVSLWYLLKGNSEETIQFDPREFYTVAWFTRESLFEMPEEKYDPNIPRFIKKIISMKLI